MGSKNPWADWAQILFGGRRPRRRDLNFGLDRFRGFWLSEGQSLPFPIDFEGRLYNTHTTVAESPERHLTYAFTKFYIVTRYKQN